MLYERWRQMARACPAKIALRDLPSGRQWTFGELAAEAEQGGGSRDRFAFPRGVCADFVLQVLGPGVTGKSFARSKTSNPFRKSSPACRMGSFT